MRRAVVGAAQRAALAAGSGRRSAGALAEAPPLFTRFTSPVPAAFDHTAVTTLPSGLRVATEATPFAQTATVGVWIDAGSRYETAATNGTAHFLEHMAFKGTKRRTTASLEQEVEDLGAHLNAYTSREQTTYYAKVFGRDVAKAVDILADILQHSSLEPAAIERERGVILREMEEVEKDADEVLFDHLHATAFQFTPLGRPILGPAANVRAITRDHLAAYIGEHYTASRMVVVGAGAVEHEELCALASAAFSALPRGAPGDAARLCAASPAHFTGSEVRMRDDDRQAIALAVAVAGAPWADPASVPLMVMQSMLGSWDRASSAGVNASSPVAQAIAANGLASSYTAFNTNYHDSGLFGFHAVLDSPDHADDAAYVLMDGLAKLAYEVDPDQLLRAKEQLKSSLMLHTEGGSSAAAEDIGRQLLTYGRRIPRAEMFARVDAVTPEAVRAAGRRFVTDAPLAVAAAGPTQFLPDYNWFTRRQYLLRY